MHVPLKTLFVLYTAAYFPLRTFGRRNALAALALAALAVAALARVATARARRVNQAEGRMNHGNATITGVETMDTKSDKLISLLLLFDGSYRHFPPWDKPRGTGAVVQWYAGNQVQ